MTNHLTGSDLGFNPEEMIACTLFEGDYHFGVVALINSLVKNGFRGCISVGYRGPLPAWIRQLRSSDSSGTYIVAQEVTIKFIALDVHMHFANFKPDFVRQLIKENPACKYIWYFDPDIIIRCSWKFYVQWVQCGIALCEDITNGTMPINHPIRCQWIQLVTKLGIDNPTPISRYYNSGFVGLPITSESFLVLWQDVLRLAASQGIDTHAFGIDNRTSPFHAADQDAMNIAAMFCRHPLSTIGPEGMNFVPGGFTMFHSVGSPKPWRKNMIISALLGNSPSSSDKEFLANIDSPICPYSRFERMRKRLGCSFGAFIGRFYHRR
jgi:hypothetical protein